MFSPRGGVGLGGCPCALGQKMLEQPWDTSAWEIFSCAWCVLTPWGPSAALIFPPWSSSKREWFISASTSPRSVEKLSGMVPHHISLVKGVPLWGKMKLSMGSPCSVLPQGIVGFFLVLIVQFSDPGPTTTSLSHSELKPLPSSHFPHLFSASQRWHQAPTSILSYSCPDLSSSLPRCGDKQ